MSARPPDVILLDLDLPSDSGQGIAHEIQARGWDIPIIVLSAAENAR